MDQKTEALQKALFGAREKADAQRDLVTKMRLQYAELTYALDTLRRDRTRRDQEMAALESGLKKLREGCTTICVRP